MQRTYELGIYFGNLNAICKPVPSWQAAYAQAEELMFEDCGIRRIAVISRSADGTRIRTIRTYARSNEAKYYASRVVSVS